MRDVLLNGACRGRIAERESMRSSRGTLTKIESSMTPCAQLPDDGDRNYRGRTVMASEDPCS